VIIYNFKLTSTSYDLKVTSSLVSPDVSSADFLAAPIVYVLHVVNGIIESSDARIAGFP